MGMVVGMGMGMGMGMDVTCDGSRMCSATLNGFKSRG